MISKNVQCRLLRRGVEVHHENRAMALSIGPVGGEDVTVGAFHDGLGAKTLDQGLEHSGLGEGGRHPGEAEPGQGSAAIGELEAGDAAFLVMGDDGRAVGQLVTAIQGI